MSRTGTHTQRGGGVCVGVGRNKGLCGCGEEQRIGARRQEGWGARVGGNRLQETKGEEQRGSAWWVALQAGWSVNAALEAGQ